MNNLSIIIPTFNRDEQLKKVLPSYLSQKYLTQIVIVDDCSTDNTYDVVVSASEGTSIPIIYQRNSKQMGAAYSKNFGLRFVDTNYVLIGEDDAWLGENYTEVLINYLEAHDSVAFASGRIIYLKPSEDHDNAVKRFYNSMRKSSYLNVLTCETNTNCFIESYLSVPFTHALIVSRIGTAISYINGEFSANNGFREETIPQLQAIKSGNINIISNLTFCFHMSSQDSNTGGQRSNYFSYITQATVNSYKMFKNYKQVLIPYSWHYRFPILSTLVFFIAYTFKALKKLIYPFLYR